MSDPQRVDMRDYSAQYARQYAERGFETVLVAARRAEVLAAVARYPHRRILEIGCGLEPLFAHLPDVDRFDVVEPSAEFAEAARALAAGRVGIAVHAGFFEDVQPALGAGAFDLIVASSLLHEVPDPRALLAAIHATCAPDTVVHLNVPNVRSVHRLLALEMGIIDSLFEPSQTERRFQRHTRYDAAALHALVREAGFVVRASGDYFVKPFTHAQMEALLDAGILDDRVLDGLSRLARHLPGVGCEMYVDLVRA